MTVPEACELCHATEERKPDGSAGVVELRPYGPGGKWICHSCGMKDEPATKRAYHRAHGSCDALLTKHGPVPLIGVRGRKQ